jgi:hypothetical protein
MLEHSALILAGGLRPYVALIDEGMITMEEVNRVYDDSFRQPVNKVAKSANHAGSNVDVSFILCSTFLVNRTHIASTVNALAEIAGDISIQVSLLPANGPPPAGW